MSLHLSFRSGSAVRAARTAGPFPWLRFQGRDARVGSRLFGPFRTISMIDGFAHVDARNGFAFVHARTADWFPYDDGNYWPVMLVEPA